MASSLGIACGGNNRVAANFGIRKRCDLALQRPCSVAIGRSTATAGRVSAVMAAAAAGRENRMSMELYGKREGGANNAVEGQERLDRWMRESVVEIVKNLREAPLLVQVFPKRSSGTTTVMTTEKSVMVEDWPAVKECWENGETPVPEGVIFVEELDGDEAEDGGGERTTRAWGVVVQGKGVGCGPSGWVRTRPWNGYLFDPLLLGESKQLQGNGAVAVEECLAVAKPVAVNEIMWALFLLHE
ncbi:hypothetical protein CR513_50813, partial [Mucuna pruriens]